jgi:hypothetical protein
MRNRRADRLLQRMLELEVGFQRQRALPAVRQHPRVLA